MEGTTSMNSDMQSNNKMTMKKSLSYNDLKRKRMLRSDRSRSNLKRKNSQLLLSSNKTGSSRVIQEQQFIKKLPSNKKDIEKFVKEIKGIVRHLQLSSVSTQHRKQNIEQTDLHSSKIMKKQSKLENTQRSQNKIITRKKSLNILSRPVYNLQNTERIFFKQKSGDHKAKILSRINRSSNPQNIDIKQTIQSTKVIQEPGYVQQLNSKSQIFHSDNKKAQLIDFDVSSIAKIENSQQRSICSSINIRQQQNSALQLLELFQQINYDKRTTNKRNIKSRVQKKYQKIPRDFFK